MDSSSLLINHIKYSSKYIPRWVFPLKISPFGMQLNKLHTQTDPSIYPLCSSAYLCGLYIKGTVAYEVFLTFWLPINYSFVVYKIQTASQMPQNDLFLYICLIEYWNNWHFCIIYGFCWLCSQEFKHVLTAVVNQFLNQIVLFWRWDRCGSCYVPVGPAGLIWGQSDRSGYLLAPHFSMLPDQRPVWVLAARWAPALSVRLSVPGRSATPVSSVLVKWAFQRDTRLLLLIASHSQV